AKLAEGIFSPRTKLALRNQIFTDLYQQGRALKTMFVGLANVNVRGDYGAFSGPAEIFLQKKVGLTVADLIREGRLSPADRAKVIQSVPRAAINEMFQRGYFDA